MDDSLRTPADFARLKIVVDEEREEVRGWVYRWGRVERWRVVALYRVPSSSAEGGRA